MGYHLCLGHFHPNRRQGRVGNRHFHVIPPRYCVRHYPPVKKVTAPHGSQRDVAFSDVGTTLIPFLFHFGKLGPVWKQIIRGMDYGQRCPWGRRLGFGISMFTTTGSSSAPHQHLPQQARHLSVQFQRHVRRHIHEIARAGLIDKLQTGVARPRARPLYQLNHRFHFAVMMRPPFACEAAQLPCQPRVSACPHPSKRNRSSRGHAWGLRRVGI